MGCACCAKHIDAVAPNHKPYRVPPGSTVGAGSAITGACAPTVSSGGSSPSQSALANPQAPCSSYHSAPQSTQSPAALRKDAIAAAAGAGVTLGGSGKGAAWSAASILAEGSSLQGLHIAPWDEADEDVASNFGFLAQRQCGEGGVFEDADGLLELTQRQREALYAWRRLPEVIRSSNASTPAVLASRMTSCSIQQGLVGDCSFLSAMSALAEYETRFGEPVLSGILHPRGGLNGSQGPVYNEYGQYCCRLFLNGTQRKVIVDDRVPVRSNGQLLCAHSAYTNEIWVTLLEKSFAKIMGSSYDMQGSNPGTDVFHLTGWVPDTIPLGGGANLKGDWQYGQEGRSASEWDEIFNITSNGFRYGHCVVCVGTSELADAEPDAEARRLGHIEGVSASTGLVARHAYPVIDCRRLGRHRLLHLKNPWGRVRWRGRFAPGDAAWKEVAAIVNGTPNGANLEPEFSGASRSKDDGRFWIEWEDVLRHFSHLYICWAPRALGLRCLEAHGRWDPEPHFVGSVLPDDTHVVSFNPQFLLRLEEPAHRETEGGNDIVAWVLLSRHVRVRSDLSKRYVAVHIYQGSSRLSCPDAPLEQGVYSNGECALVKLRRDAIKGNEHFIVVVSQFAAKTVFNFTIQVYTAVPGTLTLLPPLIPEGYTSGSVVGHWTAETAGGCSNNLWQYFQNPHWRLEVPEGELVTAIIFIECPKEYSVNVRLFKGSVARPEDLRRAFSSGAYRQGCAMLRAVDLEPGPYVAVVSTFRPNLLGDYRLAWHCSRATLFRPQPHAFAAPLPAPLATVQHRVPFGQRICLRLHGGRDAARNPTLLSARLQLERKTCVLPTLGFLPSAAGEITRCEVQKDSYAESYFAFAGAAVLLLAEIAPDEQRVLEVLAPTVEGAGGRRNSGAALYITHDGPLTVEVMNPDASGVGFSDGSKAVGGV
mmetsp:Transcript_85680/g.239422  ORF Transcript_85680/g.239422 Transcript_85680/m.239422 type:complete len:931 (+) Transcript_85680:117-2909(+)